MSKGIKTTAQVWKMLFDQEVDDEAKVKCPFHEDKVESAIIRKTYLFCFTCDRSYSLKDVLAKVFDMPVAPFEDPIKKQIVQSPDSMQTISLEDLKHSEVFIEFERRAQAAAKVMNITSEEVLVGLAKLGIKKEQLDCLDMLDSEDITFADFCEVFIDTKLTTKPRLRKAIKEFRARAVETSVLVNEQLPRKVSEADSEVIREMALSLKPLDRFSDSELLNAWIDFEDLSVQKELSQRAHGRSFIVYDEKRETINKEATLKLLKMAKTQPVPEVLEINGCVTKVYRIGHKTAWIGTCPVHDGKALFDGFCDECMVKWGSILHHIQTLVWFQVHKIEESKPSSSLIKDLFKVAGKGEEEFNKEYPKARIMIYQSCEDFGPMVPMPPRKIRVDQVKEYSPIDKRSQAFA